MVIALESAIMTHFPELSPGFALRSVALQLLALEGVRWLSAERSLAELELALVWWYIGSGQPRARQAAAVPREVRFGPQVATGIVGCDLFCGLSAGVLCCGNPHPQHGVGTVRRAPKSSL